MKAWSAWTVGMDSNTSSISANSSVARPSMASGRRVRVTVGATPRDSPIGRFSASQPTPVSTRRSTRVVSTPGPRVSLTSIRTHGTRAGEPGCLDSFPAPPARGACGES